MRLNARDISNAWSKVKSTVGHAWSSGKATLSLIGRYATVAGKLLDATSPLLNQQALGIGKQALNVYGAQRAKIESAKQLTEGVYANVRKAAPEIF